MGIVLSNEKLKIALEKIQINPKDNDAIMELVELLKPVIRLTVNKFPFRFAEDIEQELLMSIMKKAKYIAERFCSGEIENPTNYLFRFMSNESSVAIKKEIKYETHIVSLEDVKVDRAVMPKSNKKFLVLEKIRGELYEFCELRFPEKKDATRAKRYVDIILEAKRPSFHKADLIKFFKGTNDYAKESYSIVLHKIRERIENYWEELNG